MLALIEAELERRKLRWVKLTGQSQSRDALIEQFTSGQTQSVWVVKLVAQRTIEERIPALQERKAELADSLVSGATARKQPLFTESDLAELLRPLSAG